MSAVPNVIRATAAGEKAPPWAARLLASARIRVALYLIGFAALLVAGLNLFLVHPELHAATGEIRFVHAAIVTVPGEGPKVMATGHYLGLMAVFLAATALCWFATWRATFLTWTGRIAASIPLLLFLYAWMGFAADAGLIG